MNKIAIKMSVVYGLYLGWILSFLYRGALFDVVFSSDVYNMDILILLLHTLPILIIFLLRKKGIIHRYKRNTLFVCILVCAGLSIFFAFFAKGIDTLAEFVIYIVLAVIVGIAELMFIVISTGWFIRYIPVKKMFGAMALVIIIANIIVEICQFYIYIDQKEIAMFVSILACICTYLVARTLREEDEIVRSKYKIEMPKHTIPLMSIAFFLFSIGGGVVFEMVYPMMQKYFELAILFGLFPYIFAGFIVFFVLLRSKPNINVFLTIAAGFIILGLIVFQFSFNKWGVFSSEILIESGYAILDVFMWGFVGIIAYVYNKPSTVVFFTMSFNVIGVVTGSVISVFLELNQNDIGITASLISLVCAVVGMIIIPIIYKETVLETEKGIEILIIEEQQQKNLQKFKSYNLLSSREKEVVEYLISNIKNKMIAEQLFISENTLKKHAKNIYAKLKVQNKKELRQIFIDNEQEKN